MISSRAWPLAIVGLLGLNALIVGVTVLLARTGAPAVEPDYYQRAVRWDEQVARRRASAALGWTAEVAIDLTTIGAGTEPNGRLRLRLLDRSGAPVIGARIRARVFHGAQAAFARELKLSAASPGEYVSPLGPARPGVWQVNLEASRGDDTFVLERSVNTTHAETEL